MTRRIVPWLLVAAAVVFIIAGASLGEASSVFQKAIRICTECIGIG